MIKSLIDKYDGICFETTGSITFGNKVLVDNDFSKNILELYSPINFLLSSKLSKTKKNIPYIVGGINNNYEFININNKVLNEKTFKTLLFSFPVKNKINEEINLELKNGSTLIMEDYLKSLNLNNVVVITNGNYKSNKLSYFNI